MVTSTSMVSWVARSNSQAFTAAGDGISHSLLKYLGVYDDIS